MLPHSAHPTHSPVVVVEAVTAEEVVEATAVEVVIVVVEAAEPTLVVVEAAEPTLAVGAVYEPPLAAEAECEPLRGAVVVQVCVLHRAAVRPLECVLRRMPPELRDQTWCDRHRSVSRVPGDNCVPGTPDRRVYRPADQERVCELVPLA